MNEYFLPERGATRHVPRGDAVANKLDYSECAWLNFELGIKANYM
jgi:hypothetical protein